MSYSIIKTYVKNRLEGLGYVESKSPFSFVDANSREYDKAFILAISEGSIDPNGELFGDRVYDNQIWDVIFAFSKSNLNDVFNKDAMYKRIEPIIKDLDNPTNYLGTVRKIRYSNWGVEELEHYFSLTIQFEIQDQYNY